MTISKEQWNQIEAELSRPFGNVDLVCDGYRVYATVGQVRILKYAVVVYVDGCIKGEWIKGEDERARKFYHEIKRFLYPAKARAEAKVRAKTRGTSADLKEVFTHVAARQMSTWTPFWSNPRALCRHLRKTCASVEVVKIGYGV